MFRQVIQLSQIRISQTDWLYHLYNPKNLYRLLTLRGTGKFFMFMTFDGYVN